MTVTTELPASAPETRLAGKRVWVAGHRGLVGSALCRRLAREACDIMTVERRTLDLTRQSDVDRWMSVHRPQIVFVAAALVGGIVANSRYPAEFLYDNLMISANIIHAAHVYGVEKLVYLGSSCIYPKFAEQPMRETALLSGPLEPTNEAYAVAKIAALKLTTHYNRQYGSNFVTALPTNLYGPNDNFDLETSHVLPALISKMQTAKQGRRPSVEIWGSGRPYREFMHVDDLADACVFLAKHYSSPEPINVGSGAEVTIKELAEIIADVVGYRGTFFFDHTKPDGTPRKLLDCTKLNALGWKPTIDLREGIKATYEAWQSTRSLRTA